MSPATARILIIEDHELLADALAVTLGAEGMNVAIADLSDLDSLLAQIDIDPPQVALLDLDLGPPIGDGTRLIPHLMAAGTAVLVVTGIRDPVRIATAIEAGAVGYVPKSQPFEMLVSATRDAAAGRPVLTEAERHELLVLLDNHRRRWRQQNAPFERLSHREREVLAALGDGGSVDSIASASFVERSTVKTQVHAILTKLGVSSQIEAIAMARKAGWL